MNDKISNNDIISRKAAYDLIMGQPPEAHYPSWYAEQIKNMPPAHPEEFEWCDGCKEYDQEKHCCHRWSKVIRNTVTEMKDAWPDQHWIPVTVINQNYIPELKDFRCGGLLFTYRTPKGRLLVREAWVERGRIIGKRMNGIPIAYQHKPSPYTGGGAE